MRRVLLLAVLLAPASCGGPAAIPDVAASIDVRVSAEEVETGRGFLVTVVRVWRKDLEPSPWDDGTLAPLVVRAVSTTKREDDLRVEETRRLRGYAMTQEDVTIPSVPFVARAFGGGAKAIAQSASIPLRVRPVLDPEDPGPPELPGIPEAPRRTWPFVLAGLLAGCAVALVLGRRRRMREIDPAGAPSVPPAAAALRLLAAVGERPRIGAQDFDEVACILRAFVSDRFGLPAAARTREELVGALGAPGLDAALLPCEHVRFGGRAAGPAMRARTLEAAAAFVAACGEDLP